MRWRLRRKRLTDVLSLVVRLRASELSAKSACFHGRCACVRVRVCSVRVCVRVRAFVPVCA